MTVRVELIFGKVQVDQGRQSVEGSGCTTARWRTQRRWLLLPLFFSGSSSTFYYNQPIEPESRSVRR